MIRNTVVRKLLKSFADWVTPVAPHYRHWNVKNTILRATGVKIAEQGVAVGSGFRCIDGHEEGIVLHEYANLGFNVSIWNFDTVEIGKFAMVAAGVTIANGWHDKNTFEPASGPTVLGPGCWIGTNATIIGSRRIGANAVVGAGAVVVKDVPDGAIVAGVPARVIGQRSLTSRVWHMDNVYFDPRTFQLAPQSDDRP